MLAIDTETSGADLHHGAQPFYVTTIDEDGNQKNYEWDVDPLTRKTIFDFSEVKEIQEKISKRVSGWAKMDEDTRHNHWLVLQNAKFDVRALTTIPGWDVKWPWEMTQDTLVAGHLLASNRRHNLTDMAMQYLGEDIEPLEIAIQKATNQARDKARRYYPDWRIAKEGLPETPSAKSGKKKSKMGDVDRVWKYDMWLPKALAKELNYPNDHSWHTALKNYANKDSEITMALWQVMYEELHRRGLWEIYQEQMKIVPVVYKIESRGMTVNRATLAIMQREFKEESKRLQSVCTNIALSKGHIITIPKGGTNASLTDFIFNYLKLKSNKMTSAGKPSMDKYVMAHWLDTIPQKSKERLFIRSLLNKRIYDTAMGYMKSYKKYMKPMRNEEKIWYVINPSLNQTGSDTLRFSCNNPNSQQLSKREEANLRKFFGPALGREWWSIDAQNIELRIPTYMSGEKDLISIFDRPKDPPYFGSYHLAIFDVLHPELFKEHGEECKELFESTWYQWVKNGNFACVPMDTEVLTKKGWKTYDQVEKGDRTLGYNVESDSLEWVPILEKVYYPEAPLMLISRGAFSFCCTPNHRWLALEYLKEGKYAKRPSFVEADSLSYNHDIIRCGFIDKIPNGLPRDAQSFLVQGSLRSCGAVSKELLTGMYPVWCVKTPLETWIMRQRGKITLTGNTIYGCGKRKADETYHVLGAYDKIRYRFPNIARLSDTQIKLAEKMGYVETVPDRSVNPKKGYPLWCSRADNGHVLPTVPLNYYVQGTACWWMRRAMVKVDKYLSTLDDYYINMQVHDEMDFDFPRGKGGEPWRTNLPIITKVRELMESCGDDLGIPTPCTVEWHGDTWAVGMKIK